MELLVWFVLQCVAEAFGEAFFEIAKVFLDRRLILGLARELCLLWLGVVLGGGSLWLVPDRVFQPGSIPGMTLILGALATGSLAAVSGARWHTGAQLGFGFAVVRYLAFVA